MNVFDLTHNKELRPDKGFSRKMEILPDDLAVWVFSGLLRWSEKRVSERECIDRLNKIWRAIPVYLVTTEMAGDEVEDQTGKFKIPDPMFGRNGDTPAVVSGKAEFLYDLLTSIRKYDKRWPNLTDSRRKGYGVWVTQCRLSTYTREFPLKRGYDEKGTQPRVFVWADTVISHVSSELQRNNKWSEESERHFYNQLLTIVALKSKIEAMMDIDLYGNMYKLERNYIFRKLYPSFYQMKNGGLAAGMALYLSAGKEDIKELSVMSGDFEFHVGSEYLKSPHALFESARLWVEFKRRMCYGGLVTKLFLENPKEAISKLCSVIEDWQSECWHINDKGFDAAERLLPLDYNMDEYAHSIRDEDPCFEKLTEMHIPQSVSVLVDFLFCSCRNMRKIYVHDNLRIEGDALYRCNAEIIKE